MHATKSTAASAPRPEPGRLALFDALRQLQRGVATVNAADVRDFRGEIEHGECADCGVHGHELAGGDLCTDDGSGCCGVCKVSLSPCDDCGGVGYHRAGCPCCQ